MKTGIKEIDDILAGGIPKGKIAMLYGKQPSTKSLYDIIAKKMYEQRDLVIILKQS